jgi:uncharacterized protein YecT (DUF1311 family)
MMLAILLAATATTTPCEAAQTQPALDACWASRAAQAEAALNDVDARVTIELRRQGIDPKPLGNVQQAWTSARERTCAFEASLSEGGSIAPMMLSGCIDRMTRARTMRLNSFLALLKAGRATEPAKPASTNAGGQLDVVYEKLARRISPAQRQALTASESAWNVYRDGACKLEGGTCLTQLDRERVAELEAGWVGEPFW